MSEETIRADRLAKLAKLQEPGIEPYPARVERSHSVEEILTSFEHLERDGLRVSIVGRSMAKRGQGGIMFVDLFDGTARMQAVLNKGEMKEQDFELFSGTVDVGDFISVSGTCFITKRGEKSLQVTAWHMVSKSLLALPDAWVGIADPELRQRERYLDMLLDPELRAMIVRRSRFWNTIRTFLLEKDFIEVETPVLENLPGGAEARPFVTHHNALDIDVYLRICAGELWQKMLLVGGFPKVFEIGRIFRNEGQSREHLQDYTQLEFYQAYSDYHEGMQMVQDLYRHIAREVYGRYEFSIHGHEVNLEPEWGVIDFCEILQEKYSIDPITCTVEETLAALTTAGYPADATWNKTRAVDQLWKHLRKTIAGPVFLTGVPAYLEPLAKRAAHNPHVVERVQVILGGSEVGKGFSELNNPEDQRKRFEEQQLLREAGDEEAQRMDEGYIRAMEYGMPPAFGFGVSERLFSFLEGRPVHETQLFPLLRPVGR